MGLACRLRPWLVKVNAGALGRPSAFAGINPKSGWRTNRATSSLGLRIDRCRFLITEGQGFVVDRGSDDNIVSATLMVALVLL